METNIESPSYDEQTIEEVPEAINLVKAGRRIELTFHNCKLSSEVLNKIFSILEEKSCELTLKLTGNTFKSDLIKIPVPVTINCLKALDLSIDPESSNSLDYITLLQNITSIIKSSPKLQFIKAHGYQINFNLTDSRTIKTTKVTDNLQDAHSYVRKKFWSSFTGLTESLSANTNLTSIDLPAINFLDLEINNPFMYTDNIIYLLNKNKKITSLILYDIQLKSSPDALKKLPENHKKIIEALSYYLNDNLSLYFKRAYELLATALDITVGNSLTRLWNTRNFSSASTEILQTSLSLIKNYENRQFQAIGSAEKLYRFTLRFLRDVIGMITGKNLGKSKINLSKEEQDSVFKLFCLVQTEYLTWLSKHDEEQSDEGLAARETASNSDLSILVDEQFGMDLKVREIGYKLNINTLATIAPKLNNLKIDINLIYSTYLDFIFHYLKKSSTITDWKLGIDVIVLLANNISLSNNQLENKEQNLHKLLNLFKDIIDDIVFEIQNGSGIEFTPMQLQELTGFNKNIQTATDIDSLIRPIEAIYNFIAPYAHGIGMPSANKLSLSCCGLLDQMRFSLRLSAEVTLESSAKITQNLGGPGKDTQQESIPNNTNKIPPKKQSTVTSSTVNEQPTNLRPSEMTSKVSNLLPDGKERVEIENKIFEL